MATLLLWPVGELSLVRVDVDRLGRVGLADASLWALGLFSRPVVLDPRAYLGSGDEQPGATTTAPEDSAP